MTDELAARRAAVRERLAAKKVAARLNFESDYPKTVAMLERAKATGDVARQILASIRAHPSNPRPYDQEAET